MLMVRVLINNSNTQQGTLVYIAEILEKLEKLDNNIYVLAKKMASNAFTPSNEDNESQPLIHVESPFG